jgi:hypothetical protein
MSLYDFDEFREGWRILQKHRGLAEKLDEDGLKFYKLGPVSHDRNIGEYLDQLPTDIRELEDYGLAAKKYDIIENDEEDDGYEFGATYRLTSIGEDLLEKDSFAEAEEWRQEFLEYADDEYSRH